MGQFGIGQGIKRFEDVRLVRGEGRFHADVNLPEQTHAVIVRSMHAHARIRGIDAAVALGAPGVLAVFTGADVARDGLGTMTMTLKRKRPDGSPMFASPQRGLTSDRARYVGDPIAMVIAETRAQAEDAADLVRIDYEPLPSVTSTAAAAEAGSAAVWDECPDNISNLFEAGDKAATDAAFAKAARIVRRRYVLTRVHAQYLEPRGALGAWDPGEGRYTLYADVQYPHRVRNALATNIFKVPEHTIRVIVGDVGGAFGTKGWQYPEHRLVLWAARKLGRPVKWSCERREAIPADEHARDNVTDAELALDADGRFVGLRVRTLANVGAYVSSDRNLLATFSNVATLVGVYTFPAAYVQVLSVMTNTNSTAPYRGAGRPESTYVIERLIDDAARGPLRLRSVRQEHGRGAQARRRRGLPGPPRGGTSAGGAPRARHRERDREGGGSPAGVRRDPLRAERQRHAADGLEESGPGARDDVQADPARASWPRPGRRALHRRRHRPRRLWHGHDGLALDRHRRHGAVDRGRQSHREGQEDRRASAGGGGSRHHVCRRKVLGRGHRSRRRPEGRRARGVSAHPAPARPGARALRDGHVRAEAGHV